MEPKYVRVTKEKYSSLTKGLQKVADNLLTDPMTFAIHPAKQSGKVIGVSETMVIRFCNEIGYSGFRDFQREVREHLLNTMHDVQPSTNEKYNNPLLKSIVSDISYLQRNIEQLDLAAIQMAVEMVIKSEKRVVVGHYQSFSFAHWFSINLRLYLNDTILYRAEDDVQLIEQLPGNSVVFAFSFYRYAKDTLQVAKRAKERGLKVIAITDTFASPITEYADVSIPLLFNRSRGTINKAPITMSVLNVILFEIITRMNELEANQHISDREDKFYIK